MFASEGGIRTPLIISFPKRFNSGVINAGFTSVMDITPTLLELAGLAHPGDNYRGRDVYTPDGTSLLPMLDGKSASVHGGTEATGFELFGHRALFAGNWKITSLRPPHGTGEWKLFNIAADPGEQTDLVHKEPERLQSMMEQYDIYTQEKGVIAPPPDFEFMNGSLKELFTVIQNMRQ